MFISRKYKFIFLHNPKTGGTSIRTALAKIDPETKFKECFLHSDVLFSKGFLEKNGENWDDFLKFTIVRNPFERMVSFYEHMRRIGANHKSILEGYISKRKKLLLMEKSSKNMKKIKDLDGVIFWDDREMKKYAYESFEDFIKNPYYWMHKLDIRKLNFLTNYVDWLKDETGKMSVDKIIRLETIKDDWKNLLEELNVEHIEIGHLKKADNIVDWKKYYNDELKEIVYKRFEKDFEYFGYGF